MIIIPMMTRREPVLSNGLISSDVAFYNKVFEELRTNESSSWRVSDTAGNNPKYERILFALREKFPSVEMIKTIEKQGCIFHTYDYVYRLIDYSSD
jgi:hypothetical protein